MDGLDMLVRTVPLEGSTSTLVSTAIRVHRRQTVRVS